jgi:hypothetical protein
MLELALSQVTAWGRPTRRASLYRAVRKEGPMPDPRSGAHATQLAKASWVAFLLVGTVSTIVRTATGDTASNAVVLTVVYALLLGVGCGCGIAALAGVRKHGRRGILIPALIGSTLCLGMLALGTYGFVSSFMASRYQARINALAAGVQKGLPKMSGPETEFTSVRAASGELVFSYTLIHRRANEIDVPKFKTAVWPPTKDLFCHRVAPAFQIPVNFRLRYSSADGVPFAELVIKAAECAGAAHGSSLASRR